jgi:hypothetical protein
MRGRSTYIRDDFATDWAEFYDEVLRTGQLAGLDRV